ncbi:MAG: extracellular solute-binding protein [Phototrophicaceae bacterium]
MQKKALTLVLVLVLAALVGIVGAQDDVDPTGATISYWHEWDGAQGEGMTAMIALFNESNEWGITVEELPLGGSSDVRSNISTGITSGDLPNLGGAGFVNDAMGYYLDGVLVPLDAYIDSEAWGFSEDEAANLNFDVIDRNRPAIAPFDGQLLAWPVGVSAEIMSTNLDLLAQLSEQGLIDFEGAPTNVDQFAAAACAAGELDGVTAGYAAKPSGQHVYTLMLNFGGQVFDTEADAYVFSDEGSIAALTYLQDLYNDGCMYFPDGGFFANTGEFSLGLNVFAPGSSVGVPFIQGDMDSAELDYNWVNVAFPGVEGTRVVIPSLRGVTMFESTPEENLAAWLFLKWWATSDEAQVIWTESAQYQPYNTATVANLSEEFLAANPQFESFAATLADPEVSIAGLAEHPRSFDVSNVAGALLSNITIGGMDIMEAALAAEEEANALYQEDLENLADF